MTTLEALKKMHQEMSDMLDCYEGGVLTAVQVAELDSTFVMLDNARRVVGDRINNLIDFGTVK